jgi:reactive intermediate/imine deaminase
VARGEAVTPPRAAAEASARAERAFSAYHCAGRALARAPQPGRRPMAKQAIHTPDAPQPIGIYSQAVRVGDTLYLSGQIGLDPRTMLLVEGIDAQIHQVFLNLRAVAAAGGATLDDAVKFTVFLTDMANFPRVNEIMAGYVSSPYAARSAVAAAALPRGALIEIEAILVRRA